MRLVVLAVALCVLGSAATAHSRIDTTEPQDGAVLASAPTEAVLNFAKTIRLTKVELTHMDQEPIELDLGGTDRTGPGRTAELCRRIHDPGAGYGKRHLGNLLARAVQRRALH